MYKKPTFKTPIIIYALLVIILFLLAVVHFFHIDFLLADKIYQMHGEWKYTNSWFANDFMHNYTKRFIIAMFLIYLITTFYLAVIKKQKVYSRIIMMTALIVGTAMVSLLKLFFDVDCPWDLVRYGGDKPFFSLFNYNPDYLPSSRCFPAAHASVGFTLIALYFHAIVMKKNTQLYYLIGALFTGFAFGIAQQFRGAHFISHDLTSLIVVIAVNLTIYSLAYPNKKN